MLSWLTGLFASTKNAESLVDAAIRTGDALVFTDEEKSKFSERLSEWYLRYLEATQPQNKARRHIAYLLVGVYVLLLLLSVGLYVFDFEEKAQFVLTVMREIVTDPVNLILSFYFIKHIVSNWGANDPTKR